MNILQKFPSFLLRLRDENVAKMFRLSFCMQISILSSFNQFQSHKFPSVSKYLFCVFFFRHISTFARLINDSQGIPPKRRAKGWKDKKVLSRTTRDGMKALEARREGKNELYEGIPTFHNSFWKINVPKNDKKLHLTEDRHFLEHKFTLFPTLRALVSFYFTKRF